MVDDELDARVRALDAERARPETKPRTAADTVDEALGELVAALAGLYRTPPDTKGGAG